MNRPYQKPEGPEVRSAKWVVPLAAVIALVLATLATTYFMDNSENQQAVNPADQSSATGTSSGEGGTTSIGANPDARSNPGAAPAPEKAPATEPSAGEAPAAGR